MTPETYAAFVVKVLREHFPDLGTETSHLAFDAIEHNMHRPAASFEFTVDGPGSARWRLKARSDDHSRVRLAYHPVFPPGSDAGNALERTVNEALRALET